MTSNLKQRTIDFITNMAAVCSPTSPPSEWQIDAIATYIIKLQEGYEHWKNTGIYPRHRPDILYYFYSCAEIEGFDLKKINKGLKKRLKASKGYTIVDDPNSIFIYDPSEIKKKTDSK